MSNVMINVEKNILALKEEEFDCSQSNYDCSELESMFARFTLGYENMNPDELSKLSILLEEMDVNKLTKDPNVDSRSIWIGNVDYGSTARELASIFENCGTIVRANIMCNRFTGNPKGFAYIEFGNEDSVQSAVKLNGSIFRGRTLQVMPKRINVFGISTSDRKPKSIITGFPNRERFMPCGSCFRPRKMYPTTMNQQIYFGQDYGTSNGSFKAPRSRRMTKHIAY